MAFITFLMQTVGISLSGVMAPGPITAVTIGKGSASPHAGAKIAIGHGIVEFPLMIALYFGFGKLIELWPIKAAIGLIGGIFLLWMGTGMLKSIKAAVVTTHENRSATNAGIMLTLGNPYFLVWWVSVGAFLVFRAMAFGIWGFIFFALVHWLCDFFWLYFLSAATHKGSHFFGKKFQQILFGICGIFLIFFSGKFFYDAVVILVQNSR
ncbi:LysE family transporter [bacterium]|nr:LysE family transporter [bacterium]